MSSVADNDPEFQSRECEGFVFRGTGLPDEHSIAAIESVLLDALHEDSYVALKNGAERSIAGLEQLRKREVNRA